jgi:hypothetical protein
MTQVRMDVPRGAAPRVSMVIPTYYRAADIARCLDSLVAQLNTPSPSRGEGSTSRCASARQASVTAATRYGFRMNINRTHRSWATGFEVRCDAAVEELNRLIAFRAQQHEGCAS